jgi:hypothetical protein
MSLDELFKAGILPINTLGDPGAHGAGVTGVQGIGVNTPNAAAVADATAGLAMEVHIPNGKILTKGLLSIILAAGMVARTLFWGRTIKELGATPKLHCIMAPVQTNNPTYFTSSLSIHLYIH